MRKKVRLKKCDGKNYRGKKSKQILTTFRL